MKHAFLAAGAALAVVLAAGSVWADPLSDAKDGLAALNKGDNPEAVRLFTAALASGRLTRADSELAYVKRGEAFLAMQDATRALGDSNHALDLDPRDAEAAANRDRAQALLTTPQAPVMAAAPVAPASDAAAETLARYNTAMAKYDAEKKAAADAYDAEVSRHNTEMAAWTAHVAACQATPATCSGDTAAKPVTAVAAAPAPAAAGPRTPAQEVAGTAVVKKPVQQVAAKTTPPPAKKPAAKHYDDDTAARPTFF
jgi:tetratricopeptide (TPR) repeat protein